MTTSSSAVMPAECEVITVRGSRQQGSPGAAGSSGRTSSTARPTVPASSAASSATRSTVAPRPTLTKVAPPRAANRAAPKYPAVAPVSGRAEITQRAATGSSGRTIASKPGGTARGVRATPTVRMPHDRSSPATAEPILPAPCTTAVCPATSSEGMRRHSPRACCAANSGTDWHSASTQASTYCAIRSPIRPTVRVSSAPAGHGPAPSRASVPAFTLWNHTRPSPRSASGSAAPTYT